MTKWINVLICLFVISSSRAQQPQTVPPPPGNCNLVTTYGSDGRPFKSTPPQRIDSSADDKSSLVVLSSTTNNYIGITFTPKAEGKKIDGDLVVRFVDNSSLIFPVGLCNAITEKNATAYQCTFIILDKYIPALQTKPVSHVIFRLTDGTSRTVDMKLYPLLIKTGIICLAPVFY